MLRWFENGAFPLYLAPMAGVTDRVYRGLCKAYGADVMVTEFVSVEGVLRRNDRTRRYLDFGEEERPVGVQLFGADPGRMAAAAVAVIEWVRPDFIDLNFGCPASKVVAHNGGSSLLRRCDLLGRVAGEVVRAVDPFPVTAKMRIGWDASSVNAVEVARILEGEGVRAIAVHGRTRAQGYSGRADWAVIGSVAAAVGVPVVGNGDLVTPEEIVSRRAESGVAGAMIGRGAMGAPWLFAQARAALAGEPVPGAPGVEERWELMLRHARLAVEYWGEERHTMRALRARLMAYTRGMREARVLRAALGAVESVSDLEALARGAAGASQGSLG